MMKYAVFYQSFSLLYLPSLGLQMREKAMGLSEWETLGDLCVNHRKCIETCE